MKRSILFLGVVVFAMVTTTLIAQNGGVNIGSLQANESLQVGTASESVVVLSNLVALPPLTNREIQLIFDPAVGSIVYATDSDVLLVFDGEKWRRVDGSNDQYLEPPIPCTDTFQDIDWNIFHGIQIGTQCWMDRNLKVSRYPDGTYIPFVCDETAWEDLADNNTDDAYCYYDNNLSSEYGALYTYAAAIAHNWERDNTDGQGICPDGWHLPTDAEWTDLVDYLIANGYNWDGSTSGDKTAKSLASTYKWNNSDEQGFVGNDQASNNTTGFTALPSGFRDGNRGDFLLSGSKGYWRSDSEINSIYSWIRCLEFLSSSVGRCDLIKSSGFSVRCMRDY